MKHHFGIIAVVIGLCAGFLTETALAQEGANVACTTTWDLSIIVRDKIASNRDTLSIAQAATATDGIDAGCSEAEQPPPPPGFLFGVSLKYPDGITYAKRDVRANADTESWTLSLAGRHPFTLYWDPDQLPTGVFRIVDTIDGGYTNIDMTVASRVIIRDKLVTEVTIQRFPVAECVDVPVTKGWNIVSIPVHANDKRIAAIFANRRLRAFAFNEGYTTSTQLEPGVGYWMSFPSTKTYTICGQPAGTSNSLVDGWNLIGPHRDAMHIDDLTTTPSNLFNSDFFTFTNNAYTTSDSLRVGKGYWVETTGSGTLTLTDAGKNAFLAPVTIQEAPVDSSWATLRFETADGFSQHLYLSPDPLSSEVRTDFELPPVSPGNVFEARFSSNLQVAAVYGAAAVIDLRAATPPVNLSVQNLPEHGLLLESTDPLNPLSLYLQEGRPINIPAGHETFTIQQVARAVAIETAAQTDTGLEVLGNFPNPFVNETEVQFRLSTPDRVRITLFNALGQEVRRMFDQQISPGLYAIPVDGTSLPNGLYFYRIDTTHSSAVRSLVRSQ